MADNSIKNDSSASSRLVSEIIGLIPKHQREAIGSLVGIFAFMLIPLLLMAGAGMLLKIFNEHQPLETHCWQIQKAEARVFKINTCTGETAELPLPK